MPFCQYWGSAVSVGTKFVNLWTSISPRNHSMINTHWPWAMLSLEEICVDLSILLDQYIKNRNLLVGPNKINVENGCCTVQKFRRFLLLITWFYRKINVLIISYGEQLGIVIKCNQVAIEWIKKMKQTVYHYTKWYWEKSNFVA
jgi:hypothetical protein